MGAVKQCFCLVCCRPGGCRVGAGIVGGQLFLKGCWKGIRENAGEEETCLRGVWIRIHLSTCWMLARSQACNLCWEGGVVTLVNVCVPERFLEQTGQVCTLLWTVLYPVIVFLLMCQSLKCHLRCHLGCVARKMATPRVSSSGEGE